MRKQIVSSREGALKRKKRPGKARKPMRVPEVHGSMYDDDTDNGNDDDGKLLADRVVRQKPTIAAAVEGIGDDDDYDDDREDRKQTGDDDEEDSYATATSYKETPPRCSKTLHYTAPCITFSVAIQYTILLVSNTTVVQWPCTVLGYTGSLVIK